MPAKPRELMAQLFDEEIAIAKLGLTGGELGLAGGSLRLRRTHHRLKGGDIIGQRDHGGIVSNATAH